MLGYLLSPKLKANLCQAWTSHLVPWTYVSVCMKLRVETSRLRAWKGGFKSKICIGFFLLPLKIPSLHFEEEERQETGEPRARGNLPSFPACQLLCLGPDAQPWRPADMLDEVLTLIQLTADTSSTPLWPECHLLHFSGYFVVITLCLYGAVYYLHCSAPIPRRRPILNLKNNNNFVWLDKRGKKQLTYMGKCKIKPVRGNYIMFLLGSKKCVLYCANTKQFALFLHSLPSFFFLFFNKG